MNEVKNAKKDYWYLAKESDFLNDYGHIDMLSHKDAPRDHFPAIVRWMKENK